MTQVEPQTPTGEQGAVRSPGASLGPIHSPLRERTIGFVKHHVGWAISLFLVVLGAKLYLLQILGTPVPFWDQWDGEGADIYMPYLQGHLTLADLFRAHNEHRILFTHVYDLILLCLNGQWDNQLETATNALIHSAWVAGFAILLANAMGKDRWPFVWLALAVVVVPPFAWENVVGGMDCQFYFLLIASWLAICCLALSEPFSWRWWLGLAAAIAAPFTMASGLLAGATAAGLAAFEILKDRRSWRRGLPTIVAGLVVSLIGLCTLPRGPAKNDVAHSVGEFFRALGQNLAWPWVSQPLCGLVNIIPLAVLAWLYFRSPRKRRPAETIVLGIGLWVILQAIATAVGRAGENIVPASRYLDSLGLIFVADVLAIVLLMTRYHAQREYRMTWTGGVTMWAAITVCGLVWLFDSAWNDSIPGWLFVRESRLQSALLFKSTDDPQAFAKTPYFYRPFPKVDQLVHWMREPAIRSILPSCIGDPLIVERGEGSDATFQTNGCAPFALPAERCWGSWSGPGVAATGKFESLPVKATSLPFLEIPVAGNLGTPGLSLELVDMPAGKITPVIPGTSGGEGWRSAFVKAPRGQFKIVARDDSATGWFAFKEPRQMGRLSYWAMRVVAAWAYFLVAGLVSLAAQSVFLGVGRKGSKAGRK